MIKGAPLMAEGAPLMTKGASLATEGAPFAGEIDASTSGDRRKTTCAVTYSSCSAYRVVATANVFLHAPHGVAVFLA
jgi:hypothetical protein